MVFGKFSFAYCMRHWKFMELSVFCCYLNKVMLRKTAMSNKSKGL